MSNTTKTKNNLSSLQKEVKLLRSFVIGVAGKDNEGEYRPELVTRVLNAANQKAIHTFTNSQDFLRKLRK